MSDRDLIEKLRQAMENTSGPVASFACLPGEDQRRVLSLAAERLAQIVILRPAHSCPPGQCDMTGMREMFGKLDEIRAKKGTA